MTTLDRDAWLEKIAPHLDKIWAGADLALTHVERLPLRPGFVSLAEDQLDLCEKALLDALNNIRLARAMYGNKPVEGEDD